LERVLIADAGIPVKQRIATADKIPKRVDNLVDREVDAAGTPKPHPKSVVNRALNSDVATKKPKRIMMSDDDSDDDVPLAKRPATNGKTVCHFWGWLTTGDGETEDSTNLELR
jgi:hypothetical protein